MFFSTSPWLFFLFAAPGLWLTWRLYFRSGIALGARRRRVLAALALAAWIALAWFAVQPFRKLDPDVYHRPAVVLAVDESASYAALGARDAAQAGVDSARRHYESRGFRVRVLGFTESARLGRALDSLAIPNLQAVLLWSDGRFHESPRGAPEWPAPVFPVKVPALAEAQGERAVVTLAPSGDRESAEMEIVWSGGLDAVLELRAAGKTVWTQALAWPAGTDPGARASRPFALPAPVAALLSGDAGARPWEWKALLRPRDPRKNASVRNDTLDVQFRGLRRAREVFIRPLRSLEERGLVDALSSDSAEVTAVFPQELGLRAGDVLWTRAGARAPASGAAKVEYHFPEDIAGTRMRASSFDGDARVSWRDSGAAFLPAEVLRLADLGMGGAALPAPGSGVEALAWAEQDGRRGLLLWRAAVKGGAPVFGFAPPPLWRAGFQGSAEAQGAVRETQGRWVRGVAAWARGPRMLPQGPRRARDPFDAEMARLGTDEEILARMAAASGGSLLEKTSWPSLRGGQTRETRFRAAALAPAWPLVLLITALLCALWTLRKRFQID
jgi:hypothetical protein